MEWPTQTSLSVRVPTAAISFGTSAGGGLEDFLLLTQGISNRNRLGVREFDTDATRSYPYQAVPLVPTHRSDGLDPNRFVLTALPDPAFVESILRGERGGRYGHVPPAIFRTITGNGMVGSGGLVPLANACAIAGEGHIRSAIRGVFTQITDARPEFSDHVTTPLMVYEFAGCLGGTWGELDYIHDIIVEEASHMGVQVAFQRVMIYPGAHPSRDMQRSMASAAAWTKEFAARASGRYLQVRYAGGRLVRRRARSVPTWVVSDINNLLGTPSTVQTRELFTAVIAHWLRLLIATPLGTRLEAALVDFQDDALSEDLRGERRVARSFGLAFITLNRERIGRFAVQRLVSSTIELLHSPVDAEKVEATVQQFMSNQHLREGAGFTDLSTLLRSTDANGQTSVDQITRFRHLFRDTLGSREGIVLLQEAPDIFHATVAQTADAAERMREARRAHVDRVAQEVSQGTARWACEPARGGLYVQAWLQESKQTIEGIVEHATNALRQHTERVARCEETVRHLEEEAMPRFLLRFLCGDTLRSTEIVDALNRGAPAQGNARYEFLDTGDPEQLVFVQVRLSFPPSQIRIYPTCREACTQQSRDVTYETLYTELVGRFLPELGTTPTDLEAQVALAKAFACDAVVEDTGNLVYVGDMGERESITPDLAVFRRFDLRVEVVTRFFCDWQEKGPDPLRSRVQWLGSMLQSSSSSTPSSLDQKVAHLTSTTALQKVLEELEWYTHCTVPAATWWGAP